MSRKVVVMLDGGHCRVYAKKLGKKYDPDFIEKMGRACIRPSDEIYRILYYDCPTFTGSARLPVSGTAKDFKGSDGWLKELAKREFFAVRCGELRFRGYVLKNIPYVPTKPLTDADFEPSFEQKGVDMRIGLDMAIFASHKVADVIALATNDSDCIPAMKHVRRSGVQVALVTFHNCKPTSNMLAHSDFNYPVDLSKIV